MEMTNMNTSASRFRSPFVRLLLLALLAFGVSASSLGSVFVSVAIAPPLIPVYAQPLCPGPGYIWIPGYWAWGPDGYYWVPGYWALAPFIGALWTPGWWGWADGVYVWHAGYWGRRVGFYGGIDYGFGYFGVGYVGGYWSHGVFNYNTAVNNINRTNIRYTYRRPVFENTNVSRVSYHGGPRGITRQPTAQERLADREQHRPETALQLQHQRLAAADRGQWASVNHGRPSVAATARAAAFHGRGAGPRAAFNTGRTGRVGPPQINREARIGGSRVSGGAPRPPQINREARIGSPRAYGAPHPPSMRPEMRAQAAPRPEMRGGFASRPEARGAFGPRPGSRPELHAQIAPRFQGSGGPTHGAPRGGGRPEERRGQR
jgi:WXXGXW repeat (2 copies)